MGYWGESYLTGGWALVPDSLLDDYGNTKCETAERNFTTRPPVELTCLPTLREQCSIFALTPSMGFDGKARLGPRAAAPTVMKQS
jgi:hypothetical protein